MKSDSRVGDLTRVLLLLLLVAVVACSMKRERVVTGTVVDEHDRVVERARVTVGYHGWALEPYLVWDHFYSAQGITDADGRFGIDLTAPERILATVEADHGSIRNVAASATDDLRLVLPAAAPACACWSYDGPSFMVKLPLGMEVGLSSDDPRREGRLRTLGHRFLIERPDAESREITLAVREGLTGAWFPDDGLYGGMLSYHPSLEDLEFRPDGEILRLGRANGLLILRGEDAHLMLELGTGIAMEVAGAGTDVDSLLLQARWAGPLS